MVVLAEPFGSLFFGLSADLANHDDTFGLGIVNELCQYIDEVGAVEGVAADTDDSRLSQALSGSLVDCFVGEGARATDHANFTLGVDVARHDSNLALAGLDDTWAIWSDQAGFVLRFHDRLDLDHVEGGDTLCNANYEVHLGLDSLKNGVGGEGRRHVDHGGFSVSGSLRFSDRAEDGQTEMLGASFTLIDSTNDLGAICKCLFGVERTLYKR